MDLTTLFIGYLVTLKAAAPAAVDVTTLYVKADPVVIAATTEREDKNTQLEEYLD